jgi:hypothetical protein
MYSSSGSTPLFLNSFLALHKSKSNNFKKNVDVSFVGTPYNDRAKVIEDLYLKKCKEQGLDKSEWTDGEMFSYNELLKEVQGEKK